MQQYKYLYTKRTAAKIRSFYKNVAKKYRHTYSLEDMERNVRDAFFAIYAIERSLPRRKPTLSRWDGYHMANTDTEPVRQGDFVEVTVIPKGLSIVDDALDQSLAD